MAFDANRAVTLHRQTVLHTAIARDDLGGGDLEMPRAPAIGGALVVSESGKSFSIIRLNAGENGWGVVDDGSGALVHLNGLALRLSKERAKEIARAMNAEAQERGSAADTREG